VGESARNWYVWFAVPSGLGDRDVRLFVQRKETAR
jgi:hypothetical protein